MSGLTLLLFSAGLALLVLGAELLVRGASRLAAALGVSPLVIGLTVVAYGTSTPELAVSVQAAWSGSPDVAVANVVGSNIVNVLFILGLCSVILPLRVDARLVRIDVPIMIGVSVLLGALALDGRIGVGDGLLLCAGLVAYTVWTVRASRRESARVRDEFAGEYGARPVAPGLLLDLVLVAAGLALLVLGARWFVGGALDVARMLGVSEVVIGLTIVAIGTSLPELATSVLASLRGERDIAIGNVVGSSIYNVLAILGVSALASGGDLRVAGSIVHFDLPVMIAVAIACLPIFAHGASVSRWEGLLFLAYYAAYTAYLVLAATGHDAQETFRLAFLSFGLPLGVVTLAVLAVRAWRAHRARA